VITKRFGIFDHFEDIPGTPTDQLFEDRLTLIKMADEAGFAGYHLAEHHGSGLCMAPSQELFIAAASQVTTQIRLGPMVKLLPMHHPVRILEDMCILDQLTGGRLEFGVGRGAVPIEHYWFSQDWWESRDRFTDVLGIIEHALAAHEISSQDSRFFDFPTMPLSTKPLQDRIPFWYPGNPLTAGRHGMSLMWPGKISPAAYEQYLQAWDDHKDDDLRFDGPESEPCVGYSMLLSIAPTEAEARDVAQRGMEGSRAPDATRPPFRPPEAVRAGVLRRAGRAPGDHRQHGAGRRDWVGHPRSDCRAGRHAARRRDGRLPVLHVLHRGHDLPGVETDARAPDRRGDPTARVLGGLGRNPEIVSVLPKDYRLSR
jgi:alkanesulfonate monooxygenase SsuD/methylene tetrahydromethanopterin reductase-like flavin-dependent oxidoreductase (luciferase family)